MKVILLSDVKKVGKKGETVEVSDGYGRNFLLRRGLAVIASSHSLEVLAKEEEQEELHQEELRQEALKIAKQLESLELTFKVKAKNGHVSGSVSTKQITSALLNKGIVIDKRKIIDNEPIQTLGYSKVKVELYKDIVGVITAKLVEE